VTAADCTRTAASVLGAVLAFGLVPGCALMSAAPVETRKEVLNKVPVDVPRRASRGAVLLVLPPHTRPIYDTTQMAYTTQPYEIAFFSQHEWAETPAQMLQPLLQRTLQNTQFFSAVLAPPYAGRYSYALRTEIRELIADFTSDPAALAVSLRFQLSDGAAGRIVAVKEISIREPMQKKTPYAGVVAANEAIAKALLQLATFVLDNGTH
jgi:cholesterol transport system auxiliary component